MNRVAFLSDLHLGGYNTLGPDKADYRAGIVRTIRYLKDQGINHMVLLGDVFDNWTFPRTSLPLTYEQMLEHPDNAEIVAALKEVAADPTMALHYCRGNHDWDLPEDLFRTWFPSTQMENNFTLGNVWGEHGHRFDLFNAPDPDNHDPAKGYRPMGYYITRIHTQAVQDGRLTASGISSSGYITVKVREASKGILPPMTKDMSKWTVATLVLEYVVRDAGISYSDTIMMPDGSSVTVQQVSDAYKDLFKSWQDEHGLVSALNSVLAAAEQLDMSAQKVRNEQGKRLVVFGHSHIAKWNPLTAQIAGKGVTGAYVNDGALCKWSQTSVLVDYLPDTFKVTRLAWDKNGRMTSEDEEIKNSWPKQN